MTLSDPAVRSRLERHPCVKLDAFEQYEEIRSLGVSRFPEIRILGPDGAVLTKATGFMGPEELLKLLDATEAKLPAPAGK